MSGLLPRPARFQQKPPWQQWQDAACAWFPPECCALSRSRSLKRRIARKVASIFSNQFDQGIGKAVAVSDNPNRRCKSGSSTGNPLFRIIQVQITRSRVVVRRRRIIRVRQRLAWAVESVRAEADITGTRVVLRLSTEVERQPAVGARRERNLAIASPCPAT